MPGEAVTEIQEARILYEDWIQARKGEMIVENTLRAKAMALQQAGIIPLHDDPEWFGETIVALDLAGLRQGH